MDAEALLKRITLNPAICHGKPCIRELRYPVEFILELLSAGMTGDEILADYEDLEYEDILASLAMTICCAFSPEIWTALRTRLKPPPTSSWIVNT